MDSKYIAALLASGYNAAPTRLRSGTIYVVSDKPLTPHETDLMWTETFGHVGYAPYPPTEEDCIKNNESVRTITEIQEVIAAMIRYFTKEKP